MQILPIDIRCIQESVYNPYYTLVGQHLCQNAHSYRITLQYCLWDFLRELGESGIGGPEVLRQAEEFDNGNGALAVSRIRINNLAIAFGWLIAKGAVSIVILKVRCIHIHNGMH